VDPVQPARHPGAGLVEVAHRRGRQPRTHDLGEPAQPGRALGHHRGQGAGGHARAQHIGQQLRGPVHPQMLVHAQIAHQRPHPRPIAGRSARVCGEAGLGRRPTGAATPLGPVLGDPQAKRRQVEHLPGLHARHRRTRQVGAAPTAPVGSVPGHLVGLLHLRQVGAWGAGLLAGPAILGPPIGAPLCPRGLTQPVRGRRLRGVGGVLAEPALQLGHPRLQPRDQADLLGVDRAQLDNDRSLHRDGGFQIRIGGNDRGLHDNEPASPLARGPYRTATPQASDSQLAHGHGDRVLNSYVRRT
jgi:hypothetical protein